MRQIFAAVALSAALGLPQAQAKPCIDNWPWQQATPALQRQQYGAKLAHLVGSAAVTAAVATATNDLTYGIAAGLTVGAIRELYKHRQPGMACEVSSMAFDLAGVALGASVAQVWFIVPRPGGGVEVVYSSRF